MYLFIFIFCDLKQMANDAFLAELERYATYKRVPHSKLHPEYRNNLVEIVCAKLKRGATGGENKRYGRSNQGIQMKTASSIGTIAATTSISTSNPSESDMACVPASASTIIGTISSAVIARDAQKNLGKTVLNRFEVFETQRFFNEIKEGNIDEVLRMVKCYPGIQSRTEERGWTALHYACSTDQVKIAGAI